jgi:hypothetical protein
MALRRSARAGEEITLRAEIFDDLGDAVQASGVLIYLFEPDAETTDLSNAVDAGSPTYWDEGIFEYEYTIPGTGPDGIWYDIWYATLNGQTLSGIFEFEVSASGVILPLEGQLDSNYVVSVTLPSGIAASDGSYLEDPYSFSFLTVVSPGYTNSSKVLLEVGGLLSGITEDTIYEAILEASLEANQLTFRQTDQNTEFYRHARREWTTCRAAAALVTNVRAQFNVKRKRLGDFEVEYDPRAFEDLLNRIAACLDRWEPQLIAGGYAKQTPVMFIKGELDPDRVEVGRLWAGRDDTDFRSEHIPAANKRIDSNSKRRWKRGFKRNW